MALTAAPPAIDAATVPVAAAAAVVRVNAADSRLPATATGCATVPMAPLTTTVSETPAVGVGTSKVTVKVCVRLMTRVDTAGEIATGVARALSANTRTVASTGGSPASRRALTVAVPSAMPVSATTAVRSPAGMATVAGTVTTPESLLLSNTVVTTPAARVRRTCNGAKFAG